VFEVNKNKFKLLIIWAIILLVGITAFNFVHECGHGLGAQIDGNHISTGFNKVGVPEKNHQTRIFALN
jgi:hypothetical protein